MSSSLPASNMTKIQPLSVSELLKRTDLQLSPCTSDIGVSKLITNSEFNRPGMALAGYTGRFSHNRIQILGETELTYLLSLSSEDRLKAVETVLEFDVPCIIVTKGLQSPSELISTATRLDTAVLVTALTTDEFIHSLGEYLEPYFAPRMTTHGSLVDVYGIGLLFTGPSGIGKSETALDLIERGHRLVADDIVTIYRMRQGVIMGTGNELLQHYMEIRGIGIIDVHSLFGIRGIRLKKRVEVVVRLEKWDDRVDYERMGIEEKTTTLLGVEIPFVMLPIVPGKNLTVIAEVVALNYLMKLFGENPALEMNRRLVESMKRRSQGTIYDREDFE